MLHSFNFSSQTDSSSCITICCCSLDILLVVCFSGYKLPRAKFSIPHAGHRAALRWACDMTLISQPKVSLTFLLPYWIANLCLISQYFYLYISFGIIVLQISTSLNIFQFFYSDIILPFSKLNLIVTFRPCF